MMDAIKYGKVSKYLSEVSFDKYLGRGYASLKSKLYKSAIDNFYEVLNVPMIVAVQNIIKRDMAIDSICNKNFPKFRTYYDFYLEYAKEKEQEALSALEGLAN